MATDLRAYAHTVIDRLSPEKIAALLELLEEDVFSKEEIAEIQELRKSDYWVDWETVRDDVDVSD